MNVAPSPPEFMSRGCRIGFGVFFVLLPIVLIVLLIGFWPYRTVPIQAADGTPPAAVMARSAFNVTMDYEVRLLVLVVLSAALGSYIHAATSFATYAGNRTLVSSWAWWYVLRGFIGTGLGLLFYFVIRAGFLTTGADPQTLNPFGITALAALAGLFSKQAADKLREVFDNLFRTSPGTGDDQRKDKPQRTTPATRLVEPSSLPRGTTALSIIVRGTDFEPRAVVRVEGVDRTTTFVSPEELAATLAVEDVQTRRTLRVTVFDPTSSSESPPLHLTITDP